MKQSVKFVLQEYGGPIAIIVAFGLLGIGVLVLMMPLPGQDEPIGGVVTDIGPLNVGETSLNQRAAVRAKDGRSYIVDVAHYPTCRIGYPVMVHRRRTLLGVTTSVWPEGCR